eukprot:732140-Prorocentrum_minimum.AAC.1
MDDEMAQVMKMSMMDQKAMQLDAVRTHTEKATAMSAEYSLEASSRRNIPQRRSVTPRPLRLRTRKPTRVANARALSGRPPRRKATSQSRFPPLLTWNRSGRRID